MDPYIGEIRLFAGDYPPKDWAFCEGQLLPIQQYTALYSILGVTYGGDGKTTFALPNLKGRAVMGSGVGPGLSARTLGQAVGSSEVTLLSNQLPSHTHSVNASTQVASNSDPTNNIWGSELPIGNNKPYAANVNGTMHPSALSPAGAGQPHNNMQPYLALNFIIALNGIFPPKD